jgi:hypothetical protein
MVRFGPAKDFGAHVRGMANRSSRNIGLMPASPLFKYYQGKVWVEMHPNADEFAQQYNTNGTVMWLHYTASAELTEEGKELFKYIPEWQRNLRQKALSISYGPLQAHELDKRMYKRRQFDVQDHRIPRDVAIAILDVIVEKTLEHLALDHDEQLPFLNDHADRSIFSTLLGHKRLSIQWQDLDWTMKEYKERFFELVVNAFKSLPQLMGRYLQTPYCLGIRSRISTQFEFADPLTMQGAEDVARIVLFLPIWSGAAVFLHSHKEWYRDILTEVAKLIGFHHPFDSTLWNGSQCYRNVENLIKDGATILTFDGSGWDTFAAALLGDILTPLVSRMDGMDHNASGNLLTSLINTIAIMWVVVEFDVSGKIGIKILLFVLMSDDCNIVVKTKTNNPKLKPAWLGVENFFEWTTNDTLAQYVLGYTYRELTAEIHPRLCGIHVVSETADPKRRWSLPSPNLGMGVFIPKERTKGAQDDQSRKRLVELYTTGSVLGVSAYELFDIANYYGQQRIFSPREAAATVADLVANEGLEVTSSTKDGLVSVIQV